MPIIAFFCVRLDVRNASNRKNAVLIPELQDLEAGGRRRQSDDANPLVLTARCSYDRIHKTIDVVFRRRVRCHETCGTADIPITCSVKLKSTLIEGGKHIGRHFEEDHIGLNWKTWRNRTGIR